jgi:NAD(P)-dependent dehydrogenase (short-subunit alcohol dehydrogenase family)
MAGSYLITGASSGIGLATALRLAREGANLTLVARAPDALDAARAACERAGGAVLVVPADVRDPRAVERALDAAVDRFGLVDGVVHSAAVAAFGRFEDMPADVFASTIATNLFGTAIVARASLRRFREQGHGRLVVLSSALGSLVMPWMSPYIASKWAVNGLVRTLQIETRDNPEIRISLVAPGGVDTPIYRLGATYLGRHGRPLPPVQHPDAVAARVVRALDRPKRRIWSNVTSPPIVAAFHVAPALFDAAAIPIMVRLGLEHGDPAEPTPGNVLDPVPRREGRTRQESGLPRRHRIRRQLAGIVRPPRIAAAYGPAGPGSRGRAPRGTSPARAPGRTPSTAVPGGPMTEPITSDATGPAAPGVIVSREVHAPPSAVWQVLCDGWTYANWVVGTSRVRQVDAEWPEPTSRIHHAVGPWPLLIQDHTVCLHEVPERELALRARGWPLGEAKVVIGLEPIGDERCRITISEDATAGPFVLAPRAVRQALIAPRNREALYRLALVAEGRHRNRIANETSDGAGTAYTVADSD